MAVDGWPSVVRTHLPVSVNAGGSEAREAGPKATQARQACKGLSLLAVEEHPSNAEVLDMMRECGQREHSGTVVRATLDRGCPAMGDARWKWMSLTRKKTQTRQQQPSVAILTRPACDVELVEELAQEFGAMDGREAAGCAANLHAGGSD